MLGPSPEAIASRASLRRKGPRSGLSRDGSSTSITAAEEETPGESFLPDLPGEGLDRDGVEEGVFFNGVRGGFESSDRRGCVSGTATRSGGASAGVLTETRPGIAGIYVCVQEREKKKKRWRICLDRMERGRGPSGEGDESVSERSKGNFVIKSRCGGDNGHVGR